MKDEDDFVSKLQPYFASLEKSGLASVTHHELKNDTFIDLTIEGLRFQGFVSSHGPYIGLKSGAIAQTVQLGVSSISRCSETFASDDSKPQWFVAKYRNQGHINVDTLSDEGRRRLAYEFGLHLEQHGYPLYSECELFYASKAFVALQAWAKTHPRKIRRFEANTYLGDWPALAEFGLSKPDLSDSAGGKD